MYDAVAEAVPLADQGTNRKKAILVISDGNDTNSETHVSEVKQLVRQSEVLVYAIGIDGEGEVTGIFRRPPIAAASAHPGTVPVPHPAVAGGRFLRPVAAEEARARVPGSGRRIA